MGPLRFQDGIEHAPVGDAGQTILERQGFQFLLQDDQLLFGFFRSLMSNMNPTSESTSPFSLRTTCTTSRIHT